MGKCIQISVHLMGLSRQLARQSILPFSWVSMLMLAGVLLVGWVGVASAQDPLTGTLNIPGDYATLADAITDLNAQGVGGGGVTLNLIAGNPETAPAGGYVIGGTGSLVLTTTSSDNPVTIQGNGNAITASDALTAGALNDGIFKLIGADWITITGFIMQENPANTTTTPASNNMTEWGVALLHVSTTDGSQNNTIQGNTISLSRSYSNTWGVYANNRHSATSVTTTEDVTNNTTGPNNGNRVYGNAISDVNMGIAFIGTSTALYQDVGNDIGGAAAGTGNTISSWGGAAAGSGYVSNTGTSYCIFMNHQTADNVSYNTITSAAVSGTSVAFRGIFKDYTTTAPTGTFTSNITNNTVTLTSGFTSGTFEGIRSQGMTSLSTATININENTILNCAMTGASSSSAIVGIVNSSVPGTLSMSNNIIRGTTSTATTGGFTGVSNTGAVVSTINLNNNQIGTAASGAIAFSAATSGAVYGVYNTGAAGTAALSMTGNDVRGITYAAAGTGAHYYVYNTGPALTQNLSNNTFTNLNVNTTGSVYFIYDSNTAPANGTKTVNGNNIVTAFNKAGAGGSVYLYYDYSSSPATVVHNDNNNNFSNITLTGATTMYGWYNGDGGAPTKTLQNNTFTNWIGGTSAVTAMTLSYAGTETITQNTISGLTGGGAVTGISLASSIATANCSQNTINGLASTGAAAVQAVTTASTASNVFKNKIYDLSGTNASTTVVGVLVSGGTTINVYNNLIGDLRATAASAADAIRGISLTSATSSSAINLSYNTIYLNAASSGATFGTTGVYHTTSATATTAALTLRNNVITNLSTSNGTGLTVAYRRSSTTLTNYTAASNNNLFYAGVPGASRLIFYDGTNADQTLAAFQARVAPREASSVTENPPFLSTNGANPNFLHIDPTIPTQIESGGQPIAGITDDYDGEARNATAPDLGADEGTFTLGDLMGPLMTYTPLGNTAGSGDRTLTATITDPSGVPTAGIGLPVLYWKINAGAYVAATAAWLGGDQYQFTFGAGAVYPDVVSYYICAQDNAATPNVSVSPSAGAGGLTPNPPAAATPPTTPNSYSILESIAGTFTVGTSRADYATLTAAVADLNIKIVTGEVTFLLIDPSYGPSETFPITINANPGTSSTNTVTIRPDTGVTAAITGSSATALIVVNGTDYLTIDGSNSGGSSRDLTLTNTNTGVTSAVIWAQTAAGPDPATYDVFENLNLVGNANTQTLFGIGLGSTTISTSSLGTGNSHNAIRNCNISKTQYGIYCQGASAANKNTGNVFTQNLINTASPNNVARGGIWLGFENNVQVTENMISGISLASSPDVFGIALGLTSISTTSFTGNEVTNATVARNNIGSVVNTGTYSAVGISVASATSGTNLLANNMVSGVSANGTAGDFGAGIFLGGGTGSTTQVYYNSVSMSGTQTGGSYASIALAIGGSTPVVDVKNNALSNMQTTGTGNSYAIALAYSSTVGNYANLTSTNNDLYVSTGTTFYVGETGALNGGTNRPTLADWNAETGRDVPGVSVSVAAPFVSTTDLHLVPGSTTLLESGGTPIAAVTNDYDNDLRNATTPDIGADEFEGTTLVMNDMAATAFVHPVDGGTVGSGLEFAPQASFTNAGLATQTNVPVRYRIVGPAPSTDEVYNQTATIDSIASTVTVTVTFPSVTLTTVGTYTIYAASELVGDQVPGNDQITGSMSVREPLSGTYLVGIAEFEKAVGASLTFEQRVAKVTREVLEPVDQAPQMRGDKSSDDVFLADQLSWTKVVREVEETTWVPMLNGQEFRGSLCVKRTENPGLPAEARDGVYATITAAVADLNGVGVGGPVQFLLTDATYPSETFPIVVNVTTAPPTATNTVTIKPNTDVTASVSGASASSAIFKILNTNYITIDGSNAAGGTTRDLTIENTSATSPIVVWFGSSGTTPITNGTLKNCIVRNGVNTNSAVVISDGTTAGSAGYFSAMEVRNNRVEKAYIGVYATGGTTPPNGAGLTYADNQLTTSGTDAIRLVGLYMQGVNGATVSGNTVANIEGATAENDVGIWLASGTINATVSGNSVSNLGYTGTSGYAPIGINVTPGVAGANANVTGNTVTNISTAGSAAVRGIASVSTGTADVVIQRNNVHGVTNNSTGTYGAYGIDASGGNNYTIKNNFVSDVRFNMTGGAAFSTTYGVFGIRIGSGTGHIVDYNSVNLFGSMLGTANSSLLSAALGVVGTASTGCDIRNNILSNTLTGGTTSIAFVSAYLPSGGTSAMNLTWNNNAYYSGTSTTTQGIAQVGTVAGTGFYLADNFDPGTTTPATNFRAYTSTLSAAGTNDNASLASTAAAPYISDTDLHIRTDIPSPVSNAGVPIAGITDDYDGDARSATTPDIGADEFEIIVPVTISIADASMLEGNPERSVVANGMPFAVTLSAAALDTVKVSYATMDSTATVADNDYVATAGMLVFAPGQVADTIWVEVVPDLRFEPDEYFKVVLSDPVGATIADPVGVGTILNDDEFSGVDPNEIPAKTFLAGSRPNPAAGAATIFYGLSAPSRVRLDLYDLQGRLVRRLADGPETAGYKRVAWDGRDGRGNTVGSGFYFLRLKTQEKTYTKSIRILR